jgi:hypothetical protein
MSDDFFFELKESTLKKLLKQKDEMGFSKKSWDEWFQVFFNENKNESTKEKIERIFQKTTLDRYYDEWIQNFTINLEHIKNESSVRELIPNSINLTSSALVIGRGPSIQKRNHLEILSKSNYNGTILCTDGSLINVLKSGITPDKFKNFFVITIDTQERQKKLYDNPIVQKYGNQIKCILSSTVSPHTYNIVKGSGMKIFWIHTLVDYDKGKSSFNYITSVMSKTAKNPKGLPAIQTGGNVGTTAWVIAWNILKHSHVGLIGIDHGYYSDERSSDDHFLPNNENNKIEFKKAYPTIYNPIFNVTCTQDPIFQYYSNALKEFIVKASKYVTTINATEGGAIFGDGIQCTTLKFFIDNYNFQSLSR